MNPALLIPAGLQAYQNTWQHKTDNRSSFLNMKRWPVKWTFAWEVLFSPNLFVRVLRAWALHSCGLTKNSLCSWFFYHYLTESPFSPWYEITNTRKHHRQTCVHLSSCQMNICMGGVTQSQPCSSICKGPNRWDLTEEVKSWSWACWVLSTWPGSLTLAGWKDQHLHFPSR